MLLYKRFFSILIIFLIIFQVVGCNSNENSRKNPLNPDKPVTVVLWHYYNGNVKDKFDDLVSLFNETQGLELGIVVDAKGQGDVDQLAISVQNSAEEAIGAQIMPDMFASYPDTAYKVHKIKSLVDLRKYYSIEELNEYRTEFIDEGKFLNEDGIYIMPIAKSTENVYVNKTEWEKFSKENSLDISMISTWEGLTEVSKLYYKQTGKGFFGIDSNANYMIQASMQLGNEIYNYNTGKVYFNLKETTARKIWENYYIPYINGYFVKNGRFSSDDAKTGTIVAYCGSTAGSSYFPTEVTYSENNIVAIEPITIPYPYFKDGKPYAIQQGAGMCISTSDYWHEYASAKFLKWFTDKEQNTDFAMATGYFPVKNEVLNKEVLLNTTKESKISSASLDSCIVTTSEMFDKYKFYTNKPFKGSYQMRILLENHLFKKVQSDLEKLNQNEIDEEEKKNMLNDFCSEKSFQEWYKDITKEANKIIGD